MLLTPDDDSSTTLVIGESANAEVAELMSRAQQILLVVLRTVIGWHFLYEGYFKLVTPGWGPDGLPLRAWSSAGYLSGATGPLAGLFQAVGASSWIGAVDVLIPFALAAIGLGLMLGLFTQLACAGGMALLTLFYLVGHSARAACRNRGSRART